MAFRKAKFSVIKLFLLFFFVFCIFVDCNVKAAKTNGGDLSVKIKNIRDTGCVLKNTKNNCVNNIHIDEMVPEEYSFKLSSSRSIEKADEYNEVNRVSGTEPKGAPLESWVKRKKMDDIEKNRWTDWGVIVTDESKIKNKYFIRYNKVGKYSGQNIDVKATVVDFEVQSKQNTGYVPIIKLSKKWIGNDVMGVNWIKIRYDFLKSGTDEPVNVKGHTTYWDVDGNQGMIIHNNNKGIYITRECELIGGKINGNGSVFNISAKKLGGSPNGLEGRDPKGAYTEIFEGTSITRTFYYYLFDGDDPIKVGSKKKISGGGMFHSNKQVVPCTKHEDCSDQKICKGGSCELPKTPPEIEELCENKKGCDVCCRDKNSGDYYCGDKSGDDEICPVIEEPPTYTTDFNKFTYRVIDLKKPFVNRDGDYRNTGLNWCNNLLYKDGKLSRDFTCDYDNDVVKTFITSKKVSDDNALYKVHLNADLIDKIRNYNKNRSYDDDSVNCNKNGICSSVFLRKSNMGLVIEGKCRNINSESCR